MKKETKIYRYAQKINNYDIDKDGCQWAHTLDLVEQIWECAENGMKNNKGLKKIRERIKNRDKTREERKLKHILVREALERLRR